MKEKFFNKIDKNEKNIENPARTCKSIYSENSSNCQIKYPPFYRHRGTALISFNNIKEIGVFVVTSIRVRILIVIKRCYFILQKSHSVSYPSPYLMKFTPFYFPLIARESPSMDPFYESPLMLLGLIPLESEEADSMLPVRPIEFDRSSFSFKLLLILLLFALLVELPFVNRLKTLRRLPVTRVLQD